MSIRAAIDTDVHGNFIIRLVGGLTVDTSVPLRQELIKIIKKNSHTLIAIDFHQVEFVGSSGLGHFVETVKIITNLNSAPNKKRIFLLNIKEEFIRVFKLYSLDNVDELVIKDKTSDQEDLGRVLPFKQGVGKRLYDN